MSNYFKYFVLVYTGGHHEVYCNGSKHIVLLGDGFGSAPLSENRKIFRVEERPCNCSDFNDKS